MCSHEPNLTRLFEKCGPSPGQRTLGLAWVRRARSSRHCVCVFKGCPSRVCSAGQPDKIPHALYKLSKTRLIITSLPRNRKN